MDIEMRAQLGGSRVGYDAHSEVGHAFMAYAQAQQALRELAKDSEALLLAHALRVCDGRAVGREVFDRQRQEQRSEQTKLRLEAFRAFQRYEQLKALKWQRGIDATASCNDPLEHCGVACAPNMGWKLGYGSFNDNYGFGDGLIQSVPLFFEPNVPQRPWTPVYYSVDGPLYNPARCSLQGGFGYATGILGFGIDVGSDMCGCLLEAKISAGGGLVDIPLGQDASRGVDVRLNMEIAQYRGHGVPIAELGVLELHPGVGPQPYRYFSSVCAPGMEYTTQASGFYSLPPIGNHCQVKLRDVRAGDSFIVEYQFSVSVSPGCLVQFNHNGQGTIVMELPVFIRHDYPGPSSGATLQVVAPSW